MSNERPILSLRKFASSPLETDRTGLHDTIKRVKPNATHAIETELTFAARKGDVDSGSLFDHLRNRLSDHLGEARMFVHGLVPIHSGYDEKNKKHFVRALVTFPSESEARQGSLILQQHLAPLRGGTLSIIPRRNHPDESYNGEKFHPHILSV